jgi:tryptophan-rich sensory protein
MSFLRIALVTVPATVALGTLSGILSNSGNENAWFRALEMPSFMPPGWAFPVAWTALYICLGLSLALLIAARGSRPRGVAIGLFLAQLAVNYGWSPVFFGLHQVEIGLALIGTMIFMTLALIPLVGRVHRGASLLLIPYLGWLCFAFALNYQVMALNPKASEVASIASSTDISLDQL